MLSLRNLEKITCICYQYIKIQQKTVNTNSILLTTCTSSEGLTFAVITALIVVGVGGTISRPKR